MAQVGSGLDLAQEALGPNACASSGRRTLIATL
jgi:hypothetical protein